MKVQNPQNVPLETILEGLSIKYPGAVIKKPFLTPRTIIAPYENFKFLLRDRKTFYKIDFTPPVLWVVGAVVLSIVVMTAILSIIYGQFVPSIGGALWIVLSVLLIKVIYKSRNQQKFDNFYADVQSAINGRGGSSIF